MKQPDTHTVREKETELLLRPDLDEIRAILASQAAYVFADDVRVRKNKLNLSAKALGDLCDVSHTTVNNWLKNEARPKGRERLKVLGLALCMEEVELNHFLLLNGYPQLYAKNPLDMVCERVLCSHAGKSAKQKKGIVAAYEKELSNFKVRQIPLPSSRESVSTQRLAAGLDAESVTAFNRWLGDYTSHFSATDKSMLPSTDLVLLTQLLLGESTIHRLYTAGALPTPVRGQLYDIKSGSAFPTRGLREKLVVFGLYSNLADQDLDDLMKYTRLLPFTQPGSQTDRAILGAVHCGHKRFPYYEFDSLWPRTRDVVDILYAHALRGTQPPPLYEALLDDYRSRLDMAEICAAYYDEHRGPEERLFEKYYTDHSDEGDAEDGGKKGLMLYVHDILAKLLAEGLLPQSEVEEYFELMQIPAG